MTVAETYLECQRLLLRSVIEKANRLILESAPNLSAKSLADDPFAVASELLDAPWNQKNAIAFLCSLANWESKLASSDEVSAALLLEAIDLGWYAALVDTEASVGKPIQDVTASYQKLQGGGISSTKIINEAHVELHPQYQQQVESLMKSDSLSYSKATDEVASRVGVTGKTVRNHTKNPSPRNSGPKR